MKQAWMTRIRAGVGAMMLMAGMANAGTEFFVSLEGDDGQDGRSVATAFRTIQHGVDALDAGDTLTILPGEYFESVRREQLGGPDNETLIRAAIPGTVLLRGDVPAPAFEPVEGYRYVFAADFEGAVQAVNELDSLTILTPAPNETELEFTPGRFFHDAEQNRLYISTSDLAPAGGRHYTVSVTPNYGIFLYEPVRVVIEGLASTGFSAARGPAGGFRLISPRDCTVRDCTAFLNASGIVMDSGVYRRYSIDDGGRPVYASMERDITDGPSGNTIAQCRVYGNPLINIAVYNSNDDLIRDCVAFRSIGMGMRHYGALRGPAIARDNLLWGNAMGMDIKGGDHQHGLTERCIVLDGMVFNVADVRHSIFHRENRYNPAPGADNIRYDLEAHETRDHEFADPDNLDFRLQANSKFRGAGPDGVDRGPFPYEANIFYVSPDGNDAADGLSTARAWRTLARGLSSLRPGDTLYLAAGAYEGDLTLTAGAPGGDPIHVRGRGTGSVIIEGPLRVADSHGVTFERLNFGQGVTVADSGSITFHNSRLMGDAVALQSRGVNGLRITHTVFAGAGSAAIDVGRSADLFMRGNVYAHASGPAVRLDAQTTVRYSDYHVYGSLADAWEVAGQALDPRERPEPTDRYSRMLKADVRFEDGLPVFGDRGRVKAGGPLGMPFGVYREVSEERFRLSEPRVHSVTLTTANIEWMTSLPARFDVEWAEADASETAGHLSMNAEGFASLSLTGLQPETAYVFRISGAVELEQRNSIFIRQLAANERRPEVAGAQGAEDGFGTVVFTTSAAEPAPVVYYVAPDGDDAGDGRSRESAFRSLAHVAGVVGPGDTVWIAGGEYTETVRIRATGLPDRPITFRSLPGERVVLDGDNRLDRAFILSGKHHIHFDGLYFKGFNADKRTAGIFLLYRSNGIRMRRCFYDGRSGYSPSFVMAYGSSDLEVENCAIISAFYGNLYLVKCPDARVENNALLRSLIQQCVFVNEPEQLIRFRNNIITDNVPRKVRVGLVELATVESLDEGDNAYTFRVPPEERKAFMLYDPVAYGRTVTGFGLRPLEDERLPERLEQITLAEFQERFGATGSIAVNPGFAGTAEMAETDADGNPVFLVDRLLGKRDLDFPDLFVTHPELVERGLGLQPEAFKDFHFNKAE